jgi:hemerythrin-like domain-containing protein
MVTKKQDGRMILTDQLRKENETIRVALRILERISERINSAEQVRPEDLDDVVELIQVLVQRLHQKKEEDLLLSTMEESPVDEHGALAALLSEHSAIRKSFRAMKESIARYHAGDQAARPIVSESMRLYGRQLSQHLETAEKDLYERVDVHLSRKKQGELITRFERLEKTGVDKDKRLRKLLGLRQAYLE